MAQTSFLPRLPEKARGVVNVASVPQRSPFRYPGGKTWFVPSFRRWISQFVPPKKVLVEPFCGGGIVGLTALMESLTQEVVLCEKDEAVASVWHAISEGKSELLCRRILSYEMSLESARRDLSTKPRSVVGKAFQTILRNRVQHGGILAPGASLMKSGENGRGVASRWYPETLVKRIRAIAACSQRLSFVEGDAFEVIESYAKDPRTVFFVDPPYTAGGKRAGRRLYVHNEIDHERLFALLADSKASFLMTYDEAPEVEYLAQKYALTTHRIPMKNTHHNQMWELVVTKPGEMLTA